MAYLAAGISSCHEPIKADEVLERLRLGLHVMIREGSIRRDLAAIAKALLPAGIFSIGMKISCPNGKKHIEFNFIM